MIVIAGFGSIGSFIYFLLSKKGFKVAVYSRRKDLGSYSVYFSQKEEYKVENVNIFENDRRIRYLFLCTKANESVSYLREILNSFKVDNLVLTQNGIGLEEEISEIFGGNLYYLTLTSGMEFSDNKLVIFNPKKSEIVLTKVRENDKVDKWKFDLNFNYVFFRVFGNHLSVRFSKLILNLILNVVPVAFGGLPWEVFPKNEEAVKFEKDLIKEVYFLIRGLQIPFFNFRGYNTRAISLFYTYFPYRIFKYFYSNSGFLVALRDGRVPSFYRDLFLRKQRTEVEYYLGWYKNEKFSGFKLETVKKVYNMIKSRESLILNS